MGNKLEKKLVNLPKSPGVYFYKDATGEVIYIGKAANLRNRIRQYFQASRNIDPKTELLIADIADLEWTEVDTEVDALFLEAELVRRYLPRYNIMLRDDKSLQYVRIDCNSDFPTVTLVRRPLDDGAEYYGPYMNGLAVKRALRFLRRAFPYATSKPAGKRRASLHYHLGLDPGLEEGRTTLQDYRANLRKLIQYLKGNRVALVKQIEKDMTKAAKNQDFEQAAILRNQLYSLRELSRQILFSDRELQDASNDQALVELAQLLGLSKPPRRIEGFDISHIQGTDTAASMVVFTSGIPEKTAYRKFKMRRPGNDDFAHIYEAVCRRLSERNAKKWGIPDLILIDGGKGQLGSALKAREDSGLNQIPMIGLAKKFEDIVVHRKLSVINSSAVDHNESFEVIKLPASSHLVKLLQRIRDESHRFAVSYHSTLRQKRQTTSRLDEIPGIGEVTRKKIIRHFGSGRAALSAPPEEFEQLLGKKRGSQIAKHIAAIQS